MIYSKDWDVLENLQWNRAKIIVRKIAKLGATEVHLPLLSNGMELFLWDHFKVNQLLLVLNQAL